MTKAITDNKLMRINANERRRREKNIQKHRVFE